MINKQHNRGFTLVETLIAVLLLMMAIAGPLTLAEKGLHVTLIAKDQDNAFYLAQDAVEYVRWVRDTNKLRSNNWLAGLNGTVNGHTNSGGVGGDCTTATGCMIDSLRDTTASCSGACSVLNYDTTYNQFTYSTGAGINPSIFTRTVHIVTPVGTNDCSGNGKGCEASVTVTVTWRDQGMLLRTINVQESIFDWQ